MKELSVAEQYQAVLAVIADGFTGVAGGLEEGRGVEADASQLVGPA
jgi:hypothetical protein